MDVVSKREKPKYSHNGHQYVFDKLTKDGSKKMWRCDRKDHGCKARLHTDAATDDVIGDVRGAHTHGSDAAGVEVAAAVGGMKRRAAATQDGKFLLHTFLYKEPFSESPRVEFPNIKNNSRITLRLKLSDIICCIFRKFRVPRSWIL